jgi:thiol:disulfide interchange protein DsbD
MTRLAKTLSAWLLLAVFQAAPAADDILKPEQAFRYAVTADSGYVDVRWNIAPEHYLYRERMSFRSRSDGIELGEPELPAGKPYEDEFFGRMEIYRGEMLARIPYTRSVSGLDELELEIRSQGCADIGLCYPPQRWLASVDLPATSGTLSDLLGNPALGPLVDDPLPVEQAFQPVAEIVDPFTLAVTWNIAPGYYLYRDSLSVTGLDGVARPGPISLPPGTPKYDEHFGDTEVFYDQVRVEVPLLRPTPDAGLVELQLAFQGCKEDSICYPPSMSAVALDLPDAGQAAVAPAPVAEQDRLSALILNGNLLLVVATFAGLGLLLAFTPCVLPMLPILSGIIAGQGKDVTTGRAFALSLTYVLGMALTYTVAGAAFAAAGGQIQAALQKPWIIIGVAGLFVALALSMFGLYEIQMPAAIQTRLTQVSGRQKSGTYFGTAMMGAMSALVVTTCVAPPLVASLMVIAQSGDIARGALSLFAMSIGMGIPLLVVGTSAGKLLPKAGAWMDRIKGAFGFMMLGLAIWMLERILPGEVTLLLWAGLVFIAGVFLGAFQPLTGDSGALPKLGKGLGLMAALYGAALLIGALGGARDPLQPLAFINTGGGGAAVEQKLEFRTIKSVADLEAEVARASAAGKSVMLDFYADWCVSCKEMERYTFSDGSVQTALNDVVLLKADVTANDELDQELLQYFGIFGPPTIVFFDRAGEERDAYRIVGFMPAEEFADHVGLALSPSV